MKLFKRGDLSLRYLVLAILGLTVLVIIILIFLKGSGYFTEKIKAVWNVISAIKPKFSSAIPKK